MSSVFPTNGVLVIATLALAACGGHAPGNDADGATSSSGVGESSTLAPTSIATEDPSDPTVDPTADSTGDPCTTPDADDDGFAAIACGGDDCDDTDALVNPSAAHDGWEQLVLNPMPGGGMWRHHQWIIGADGLVDLFYSFNTMLIQIEQENDVVWDGGTQIGTGFEPAVALAPDGGHHLVYAGFNADQSARGIFHMRPGSPELHTIEELPVENPNPFGLDIAVDPDSGVVHVVYGVIYEFPPTFRYATSSDGQTWATETISSNAAGYGGTILLDDDGTPHVSFSSNDDELMHAVRDGDSWSTEVIATGYETAATSMARDPNGELHIAFAVSGLEDADDGLQYVRTENGTWGEPMEVDADVVWYDEIGAWDYRPAIVADTAAVHLAWHDHGTGSFHFATRIGEDWAKQILDDGQGEFSTQSGWDPELQLVAGELHIGQAAEAHDEYRHLIVVPDDGRDNDCDGMIDEGP